MWSLVEVVNYWGDIYCNQCGPTSEPQSTPKGFMPSRKYPNIAVLITLIFIGAIFASIVGVIAIILHSYIFSEMIIVNFQMYNNPFPHAFHLMLGLVSVVAFIAILASGMSSFDSISGTR